MGNTLVPYGVSRREPEGAAPGSNAMRPATSIGATCVTIKTLQTRDYDYVTFCERRLRGDMNPLIR
jgi:hypothetical protein